MAVALAAARQMADRPLGHAVPGDFLYSRFAEEAFAAGELPEETRTRIIRLQEGGPPEKLHARVLMLVYMLGLIQRDVDAHGVRPTPEVIADLLVEDLGSAAELRAEVPKAIAGLAEAGAIIEVSGIWQLQTKESAEWDRLFRAEERTLDSRSPRHCARTECRSRHRSRGGPEGFTLLNPRGGATWRTGSRDFARAKEYLPTCCPHGSTTDGSRTWRRSRATSPHCPPPTPAFTS